METRTRLLRLVPGCGWPTCERQGEPDSLDPARTLSQCGTETVPDPWEVKSIPRMSLSQRAQTSQSVSVTVCLTLTSLAVGGSGPFSAPALRVGLCMGRIAVGRSITYGSNGNSASAKCRSESTLDAALAVPVSGANGRGWRMVTAPVFNLSAPPGRSLEPNRSPQTEPANCGAIWALCGGAGDGDRAVTPTAQQSSCQA